MEWQFLGWIDDGSRSLGKKAREEKEKKWMGGGAPMIEREREILIFFCVDRFEEREREILIFFCVFNIYIFFQFF